MRLDEIRYVHWYVWSKIQMFMVQMKELELDNLPRSQ